MPLHFVPPQLAQLRDAVPTSEGWQFEVKYDGYRLQALVEPPRVRLLTRTGLDWTTRFPTIAARLTMLPVRSTVLDGEAIAVGHCGGSAFSALQDRLDDSATGALQYVVFDLLHLDGHELRDQPFSVRWDQLTALLRRARLSTRSQVRLSERLTAPPDQLIDIACRRKLEGVISKRRDAPYRTGRGPSWVKVKCTGRQEFVVVGFTPPNGSRHGLGSLLLAVHDAETLRYAGRVGSGFDHAELTRLVPRLERLERERSPLATRPTDLPAGVRWVMPRLVAEVNFTEWTDDGRLRHPVFLGLRTDKPATEVRRERAGPMPSAHAVRAVNHVVAEIEITHPDREVYPEAKTTKIELAQYFARVAPLMLPHIANRPLAVVRCPEGSAHECFFQKHWTGKLPTALDTVPILQSDGKRHPHVVVKDAAGLVTLAQWGVLEVHPWGARADDPERPDRIVFDLDPGAEVSWATVTASARGLAALLHELGLDSWVKTSGGKGLHLVVPIARRSSWDDVSRFARLVAEHMAEVLPDRFLSKASKAERNGKIFVDWIRNTRGATSVGTWSPRARPSAGISVPLTWPALGRVTAGDQFTVAAPRIPRGADPWAKLLSSRQGLTARIFAVLEHS